MRVSISALEDYAACPFKFFVVRGLRAEERQQFEADPRERGSFQHEIMMDQDICRNQFWAAFDAFVPGTPLFGKLTAD